MLANEAGMKRTLAIGLFEDSRIILHRLVSTYTVPLFRKRSIGYLAYNRILHALLATDSAAL